MGRFAVKTGISQGKERSRQMSESKKVSGLVNEWLASVEPGIARSTYVKYEQLARNYILPYFENMTCEELDNKQLHCFYSLINQKENTVRRPLSAGNQRTIFMIMNNTLDYAYDSRVLDQKYYIRPRLTRQKRIVHVFSQEHQRKIEDYILHNHDGCSLAVTLALFTGLRLGEICALQWSDISFEGQSLYVNKTVQRLKRAAGQEGDRTELMVSHPKSAASNRLIPLPVFLMDYLKKFPHGEERAYVLTNAVCTPMEPRTLQYHYQKMLMKIGVPYLNFHCLRHTFATRCVTLGWDMKTLSEILGHFDIKITMEYYFHSSFEYKQTQMNKIIPLSQN